jgi:hypothetical protein
VRTVLWWRRGGSIILLPNQLGKLYPLRTEGPFLEVDGVGGLQHANPVAFECEALHGGL